MAARARAQQPTMPVIGLLHLASAHSYEQFVAAFRQGLNEGGYIEGQNVAIEYRWAEGQYERLRSESDIAHNLLWLLFPKKCRHLSLHITLACSNFHTARDRLPDTGTGGYPVGQRGAQLIERQSAVPFP